MRRLSPAFRITSVGIFLLAALGLAYQLGAQQTVPAPQASATPQPAPTPQPATTEAAPSTPYAAPIAIVPLDSKNPDAAAKVTGALEVSQGRAVIVASGTSHLRQPDH